MTLSDIGGTTLSTAGFDELSANKLWQRLPAVRAGNVSVLSGSTYYGSRLHQHVRRSRMGRAVQHAAVGARPA